jgi:biotin carboxylase
MGSVTPTNKITKRKDYMEINSAKACEISGNKIKMKERFTHGKIATAEWFMLRPESVEHNRTTDKFFSSKVNCALKKWKAIIVKRYNSSGGKGIFFIQTPEDFDTFYRSEDFCNCHPLGVKNYIFERYYTYSREYRIHVTEMGCFLADRKMLIEGAEDRWHRHANNSVWISEENPKFDKPTNWNDIVTECINAMKSIGLDVAAFDVKVQNNKHENPKFIILESNSAPSLGEQSLEAYKQILCDIING